MKCNTQNEERISVLTIVCANLPAYSSIYHFNKNIIILIEIVIKM